MIKSRPITLLLTCLALAACQATPQSPAQESTPGAELSVLAAETFLADIAQNVAGERVAVESILPLDLDPHTYEPTPQDLVKITNSQLLIVNGAGFEFWMDELIENSGGEQLVIEASEGLAESSERPGDPHFWLDPVSVITYVENIRDGLSTVDPAGEPVYRRNAAAYIDELKMLDVWIMDDVKQLPKERRILVTNHESFGYYADRYGFEIIGTIIPSASTGSSPSAQQLVQLVDEIRRTNAPAIFLESGSNPQLAEQVARETDVKVIGDLYTHSISPPDGAAPSYLDMMMYNTRTIVEALK
jgi:ABC-type Zn uptake system ZnuABC Zn-binding protein ZnuA